MNGKRVPRDQKVNCYHGSLVLDSGITRIRGLLSDEEHRRVNCLFTLRIY